MKRLLAVLVVSLIWCAGSASLSANEIEIEEWVVPWEKSRPRTRVWGGQQVHPTDCEHRRRTPWEGTSDASPTGSVRDAGPRERRRVQGEV